MTMSGPVVGAVLLAALLHASWNALVKSSANKEFDMALIPLLGSVLAIPMVAWFGWPESAAWPYLVASAVIHMGYYSALIGAYRHGDLGLTYPVMRGTAPLLVALSASVTLGETLSPMAWLGVAGISGGVLVLGLGAHALQAPKALGFALLNAAIIALYTVVDGLGVRAGGNALQYIAALFLLHGWPFALVVFWLHGKALPQYARKRWPVASLGASATLGSYGLALWGMSQAPVATVAALRETSVLFALVLGVLFLGERFTKRRLVGAGVIVAGIVALRMG
jgi:phosphonate utilization associated putative membrane protein